MKSLNFTIGKVTKKISNKQNTRIIKIQQNWELLIGPEFAGKIVAEKISGKEGAAKLFIAQKEPCDYFVLQELKETIIKNINEFFGRKIIKTIIIKNHLS